MTSPISPVSVPNVSTVNPARPAPSTRAAGEDNETSKSFAGAIGDAVSQGLQGVAELEQAVDVASQQAAVGNLESVSDFMIATTEAQLATEITVAVRDRAITAFNDIMRMQI
jgi:flagellar hook-basal body complex protein FliE